MSHTKDDLEWVTVTVRVPRYQRRLLKEALRDQLPDNTIQRFLEHTIMTKILSHRFKESMNEN